jgi:hypothetical protein
MWKEEKEVIYTVCNASVFSAGQKCRKKGMQ